MSKKKKKEKNPFLNRWHIPNPTPYDAKNKPDLSQHVEELLNRFIRKTNPTKQVYYYQLYDQLLNQYNEKLRKTYPSIQELDRLDRIDLTSVSGLYAQCEINRENIDLYHKNTTPVVYAYTPCFQKGCMYFNQNRRIFFEIQSIQDNTISIFLRDYNRHDSQHDWNIGVSGQIDFSFSYENGKIFCKYVIKDNSTETYIDLYSKFSPSEMKWDREKTNLWQQVLLQNAVDQMSRFKANNQNPILSLAKMFKTGILFSNFCLSKYKPVIERENKSPSIQHATHATPKQPPKQRIRTVGTVRFTSVRPPRQTQKETIRIYTLASWPVRGHTRTYKSGKTIYVKPTVYHRKQNLQAGSQDTTQNIIRIKQTKQP